MSLPADYLEQAVHDVLASDESHVDATIGHAALLLASIGSFAESDRLVRHWQRSTERLADRLATDALTARAWAMVFEAREQRPDWADALSPLDLDAEDDAHHAYLRRKDPPMPTELAGDSALASMVGGAANLLGEADTPDPMRTSAARAEDAAKAGDRGAAEELVREWAQRALRTGKPEVAMLAGARHVARLLTSGMLAAAFGIGEQWPARCAGDLIAALHSRYQAYAGASRAPASWSALIERIMALRTAEGDFEPDTVPEPASWVEVLEAEQLLGVRLPSDYREFLFTCDGLPGDVVFPRLLAAEELRPGDRRRSNRLEIAVSADGPQGVLALRQPGSAIDEWTAIESDPTLGETVHASFRALLEDHLRLLEQLQQTPLPPEE